MLKNNLFIFPAGSFISSFTNIYIGRHKIPQTTVFTSIFESDLTIEIEKLEYLLKNVEWKLIVISPDSPTQIYNYFEIINWSDSGAVFKKGWSSSAPQELEKLIIVFSGFSSWSAITNLIHEVHGIIVSGGDSSKRHLMSYLSLKLPFFLFKLFDYNSLRSSLGFNLPKNLLSSNLHLNKNINPYTQEIEYHQNTNKSRRKLKKLVNNTDIHPKNKREYSTKIAVSPNKFNIYSELKFFIENNKINNETQIKIEEFLINNGINIVQNNTIGGINSSVYSKKLNIFIHKFLPDLKLKVDKFMNLKKEICAAKTGENQTILNNKNQHKILLVNIIELIGKKFVISVLLGRFIKIISNSKLSAVDATHRNLALNITLDLSKDLINEYFWLKYKKSLMASSEAYLPDKNMEVYSTIPQSDYHNNTFSSWKKENEEEINKFDDVIRVKIGAILCEWLEDCNLISRRLETVQKIKHNLYETSPELIKDFENTFTEVLELTDKSKENTPPLIPLIHPLRIPMIVKPKSFEITKDKKILGGYLLNDVRYSEDLILKNYALEHQSNIKEDNIIYDLINNMNSVGYKVNSEVLDFIQYHSDLYTTTKNPEIFNEKELKTGKITKTEEKSNKQYLSKLEQQKHIINIANVFRNVPEFYFVNRIDNRGRIYCMTEYFNYQSTDLSKALILFSKPVIVKRDDDNAFSYLKVYGANCYGGKYSKMSIINKIKWIDNNTQRILNYENGEIILEAENKLLFTAFCFEYKKWWNFYYNSSDLEYKTHFPIQLDASCNGFQHLVLLTGEIKLWKELNLTSVDISDPPKDFYSYILELLKDYLNNLDFKNIPIEKHENVKRIKKFFLDRKLVKKVIMTIPYNATPKKMSEEVASFLIKEYENETLWLSHPEGTCASDQKLTYSDLYLLISYIKNVINSITPKTIKLQKYLGDISKLCTKLELHIPWLLPTGLEVKQSYLKEKSVKIKPFTYSESSINISSYIKKLDLTKQTRAFMPNLIHSLDASSLSLLLTNYFKNEEFNIKNIYTIHDCFAMPMNHVEYIIDTLRKVYFTIYSESCFLEQLDEYIFKSIQIHYRNVELNREQNELIISQNNVQNKYFYPNIKEVLGLKLGKLDKTIPYILV